MSFIQGLQTLLRSGDHLPTLPTVVFQLHRVLDDEDASSADVAAVIELDPALTARLLRAANSAALARGERVASVDAAIQRLGVSQVRALCIVLAVVQAFGKSRGLAHDALWAHSAAVGTLAKALWIRRGGARGAAADDLYVAGLLHDVGLLVLDQFFPAEFDQVQTARQEMDLPVWQQEEDSLGMDHGDIGGLLLGSWGLPATTVDAVTFHHRPGEAPAPHLTVCRTVAAAEAVAAQVGFGLSVEAHAAAGVEAALAALGIGAPEQAALLDELRELAERSRGMFT